MTNKLTPPIYDDDDMAYDRVRDAAPDMLVVLKDVKRSLDHYGLVGGGCIKNIEAVIRKAEGE